MVVSVPSDIFQQRLLNFEFRPLFNELMWNTPREQPFVVTLEKQGGLTCTMTPIAEKSGYKVYHCLFPSKQHIPPDVVLRHIGHEVAKRARENIIIYSDAQKELQIWQWVRRERGKPSVQRLSRLHKGQSGELLTQKVSRLLFHLDDDTTITGVAERTKQAFDTERVTKKFYDRFQKELGTFQHFIHGITAQGDKEWYASLMLNRLMFIYFIQKKGFLNATSDETLNGELDYLRRRMEQVQTEYGQEEFHTFYRYFLLQLFSDLNTVETKRTRSPEMDKLLGRISYLNGGLFDVHPLEHDNPAIHIPDEAFKRVFDFFDDFDWYLDDRELHNDKEINPDVLGYIFEKYINQKQMGAYYTKEDITDYISKNTIIPFLFNEVEKHDAIAFRPDGPIWSLLKDDPDAYIYDDIKKGVDLPLPDYIEAGIADISQRIAWNRAADEEYALPTETWREVVTRHIRYSEVRAKLANGAITSINDLITYNLDITSFARDVLTYCEDPDLLRAFYHSIEHVTVLDPTCGSGAFLFAALNILYPLYEACLIRMQEMVNNHDTLTRSLAPEHHKAPYHVKRFREILTYMNAHANRAYFILKSIILNNLYGVDIMAEATEICKLRLFLKLVSQVQRYKDIEPLPDIDFNIRPGNTLVGFASYNEASESIARQEQGKGRKKGEVALQGKMDFSNTAERMKENAQEVERAFRNFREAQTNPKLEHTDLAEDKRKLRQSLKKLEDELNTYLATEYGYEKGREEWRRKYQPFHWFVEFYEIIEGNGGFDVIIGNPPYVAYSKVRNTYRVHNLHTLSCNNLYAFIMERTLQLLAEDARFGMIVPVSSVSGESYEPLMEIFSQYRLWLSSYSNRPAKLFAGVEQRLTIFIAETSMKHEVFSSPYQHWYETERDGLLERLSFVPASLWSHTSMPIKSGTKEAESVFARIVQHMHVLSSNVDNSGDFATWFHDSPTYWVRALPFEPNMGMKSNRSNHYHAIPVKTHEEALILSAILSSSTFYLFFKMISNCRDLGQKEWTVFPLGKPTSYIQEQLTKLGQLLEHQLRNTAITSSRTYPSGIVEYEEYYPAKAKPIIDEIDRVLAQHYGFTNEELDFIINYDIKYRMGRDNNDSEEEDGK